MLLSWNETDGLHIPLQALSPNSSVFVPISDDQLARFEEVRSGREPEFSLRLEVVAQHQDTGEVRVLNHGFYSQRLPISRDSWATILDRCGFGLRLMVELPPPPRDLGGAWDDASRSARRRVAVIRRRS